MAEERERVVMPGDYLCVEEEFLPGPWTYVDDNGVVRSLIVGTPVFDYTTRRVSVKPLKRRIMLPKQGDNVVGVVSAVKEDVAVVKVIGFDIYNPLKNPITGLLHISQISETRIDSVYDAVRMGDLIRARVLNNYVPLLLSIKDPKYGVILAYCSKCGSVLVKKGETLVCPSCGSTERRKVSIDYLAVERSVQRGRR